ncbi:MAG: hypothetical protein FD187_2109 [bacterium]|nr:MAG: hypothetical protein FD142_2483 [bacterium]KAF0148242.1 MAG: hypothetical protein FD187_2109 [bacterium]KAF0167737.1 MAG: hypothetical protein FD158_1988 [bacterium]TXT20134.1 MAG: hypothetical protein FD132_1456 [bacterium]
MLAKYYMTDRPEVLRFLESHGRYETAIDIGCASGALGASLIKAGLVGVCDGIEPNEGAAEVARTRLRHVWHGTLDAVSAQVPWSNYNMISMTDVLEHLSDPWAALRHLHTHTRSDCTLLLSVPNVRHYHVSLPLLLLGEFRYTDHGIMDRTHLHLFTRNSLIKTLNECGWEVVKLGSHMKNRYRRWFMPTRALEPFVAVQYLVIARKQ